MAAERKRWGSTGYIVGRVEDRIVGRDDDDNDNDDSIGPYIDASSPGSTAVQSVSRTKPHLCRRGLPGV